MSNSQVQPETLSEYLAHLPMTAEQRAELASCTSFAELHARLSAQTDIDAAEAAQAQGQTERRDAYLQQAAEQHPRASLAVSLIRARLLLRQKQYSEAETLLQSLDQAHPQHAVIQQLLKECYLALGHWSQLLALLPQLSKRKQVGADELQQLQQQIYPPLFAERAASAGSEGRSVSKRCTN